MTTSPDIDPIDFNKIIKDYQHVKQVLGEAKLDRLKVKTVKESVQWTEHGHSTNQENANIIVHFQLTEGQTKGLNSKVDIPLLEKNHLPLSTVCINLSQSETKETVSVQNKEFKQREFTGDVTLVLRLTGNVLFQSAKEVKEIPFSQILTNLLEEYSKSRTSLPKYISPLSVERDNMNLPIAVRWTLKGHVRLL